MLEAVRRQVPLLKAFPDCPASQDIQTLGRRLLTIRETMLHSLQGKPVLQPGLL